MLVQPTKVLDMDRNLPDFDNPPVVEVVLSLQFEPLDRLRTPQMGAFWSKIKGDFPQSEEHPSIDPVIEEFNGSEAGEVVERLRLLMSAPVRHWYLSGDGTSLIQIQRDRFIQNWRKGEEGQQYPRFEKVLKPFKDNLRKFEDYLRGEGIGTLTPNQCEVTYINHIPKGQGWSRYDDIGHVVTLFSPKKRGGFLPEIEEARFGSRFVIPDKDGNPIGRLYISADPGIRKPDNCPTLRLNLTARGRPISNGVDGVFGFFEIGHEWIVEGFAAITSAKMHKIWKRKNA